MMRRLRDCGRSFRALPGWVQAWVVLVLVPVNTLPFLILDSAIGRAGAAASLFVVLTNLPIMLIERGMSRLMAVPHLIAWIPLSAYLVACLTSAPQLAFAPRAVAWAMLAANGVSLAFDALDAWRWWHGERAVPGHTFPLEEP